MSNSAHEEAIRRLIEEVINKGNYALLGELLHPNYVFRTPDQELRGPAELEALFTAYRNGFPDLVIGIEDLFSVGDKVVLWFTFTGTHQGDLLGVSATGKEVHVHGIVISRFEDGKIVEEWEVLDQLALFQQLGLVSLPG